MDQVRLEVNATMIALDGGPDADLPEGQGVVVAGPEAIFVAGRVAGDAPTVIRVADGETPGNLVLAYSGDLATPNRVLRLVDTDDELLAQVEVPSTTTPVSVYLTDLEEPDEILIAISRPSR